MKHLQRICEMSILFLFLLKSAFKSGLLFSRFKHRHKGMIGSVLETRRRERIAFLAKFGEARHGRTKAGLGRSKTKHFSKKIKTWYGRKRVWTALARADRVSWKTVMRGIGAEKQGPGAANQSISAKNTKKDTPKQDGRNRVWTPQA